MILGILLQKMLIGTEPLANSLGVIETIYTYEDVLSTYLSTYLPGLLNIAWARG